MDYDATSFGCLDFQLSNGEKLNDLIWTCGNTSSKRASGQKPPSFDIENGIYEIQGNLNEWYGDNLYDLFYQQSGTYEDYFGIYYSSDLIHQYSNLNWTREYNDQFAESTEAQRPYFRTSSIGFRLVRTLPNTGD